mgnify:CR=1 FL=1
MLCDHDDTLEPDALFEIVKAINDQDADVIYTDEDKVSMDGQHYFDPHFKSDFNLFRFRDNNYICHIFAVKRQVAEQAGYFRKEFDGSQDFDFIFRCCEKAEKSCPYSKGSVSLALSYGFHGGRSGKQGLCFLKQDEKPWKSIIREWESRQRWR